MTCKLVVRRDCGVAYFRYTDHVTISDGDSAMAAYRAHADFDPRQKQFLDFSGMTSFEIGYLEHMAFQAKLAGTMTTQHSDILVVFYAPTELAMEVAMMSSKSWDGVGSVVVRIAQTESDALAFLGQRETSLRDFLAVA